MRANYFIDDHEIEYFVNPINQVRAYFANESHLQPHTAHMFATGLVLYQRDPGIEDLVSTAKQVLQEEHSLEGVELQLLQYSIDDGRKDLLNMQHSQQKLGYQVTANRLFERILVAFIRYHDTSMSKPILLMDQLKSLDPQFAELVARVIENRYSYDSFLPLIEYTENLLGGRRPDKWELKGPLDL